LAYERNLRTTRNQRTEGGSSFIYGKKRKRRESPLTEEAGNKEKSWNKSDGKRRGKHQLGEKKTNLLRGVNLVLQRSRWGRKINNLKVLFLEKRGAWTRKRNSKASDVEWRGSLPSKGEGSGFLRRKATEKKPLSLVSAARGPVFREDNLSSALTKRLQPGSTVEGIEKHLEKGRGQASLQRI